MFFADFCKIRGRKEWCKSSHPLAFRSALTVGPNGLRRKRRPAQFSGNMRFSCKEFIPYEARK